MMRIIFTDHAKQRCDKRNISQKWLEARLRKIPISEGVFDKVLDGTNIFVAYRDTAGHVRLVITLYLGDVEIQERPKQDVRKITGQHHVHGLYEKSKQKRNRRLKKQGKLKKK